MNEFSWGTTKKETSPTKTVIPKLSWNATTAEEKQNNAKLRLPTIQEQKDVLISEGKPVSLKSNQVEPTMGGNLLRSLIKPVADVATSAVNTAQVALGKKETQPFTSPYLGKVEGLGKVDVFKSPLAPENLKTIKKSVGTGAELASYLAYGGIGTKVAKGAVSKLTETAAKDTFKEYVKKALPSLLKEGALTGVAQTGGSQLSENADTGKEFSWKQALTDVALSTALTPLAALGIQRALGTSSKKILDARAGVPKSEIEANIRAFGQSTRPPVPPAGLPPTGYVNPKIPLLEAPKNIIELPGRGILESQQKIRDLSVPNNQTTPNLSPIQKEANQFNSKKDFINFRLDLQNNYKKLTSDSKVTGAEKSGVSTSNIKSEPFPYKPKNQLETRVSKFKTLKEAIENEIGFYLRTKQKTPKNITSRVTTAWNNVNKKIKEVKQPEREFNKTPKVKEYSEKELSDIWEESHRYPEEIKPTVKQKSNMVTLPKIDQATGLPVEAPKVNPDVPTQKESPINDIPTQTETPKTDIPNEKIDSDAEFLQKLSDDVDNPDKKTFVAQSARFNELLQSNKEGLLDYVRGKGADDPVLTRSGALQLLQKHADDIGDTDLSDRLSFLVQGTKEAQELVSNKIVKNKTTADIQREARAIRAKALGISEAQLKKEEFTIMQELKKELDKNVKITDEDFDFITKDITC